MESKRKHHTELEARGRRRRPKYEEDLPEELPRDREEEDWPAERGPSRVVREEGRPGSRLLGRLAPVLVGGGSLAGRLKPAEPDELGDARPGSSRRAKQPREDDDHEEEHRRKKHKNKSKKEKKSKRHDDGGHHGRDDFGGHGDAEEDHGPLKRGGQRIVFKPEPGSKPTSEDGKKERKKHRSKKH